LLPLQLILFIASTEEGSDEPLRARGAARRYIVREGIWTICRVNLVAYSPVAVVAFVREAACTVVVAVALDTDAQIGV
jgi:hypothetical protein